jgi:DNA-binding transcriptional LysR family regulator
MISCSIATWRRWASMVVRTPFVPVLRRFIRLTEAGLGWGLVPELQVREQLQRGALLELCQINRSTCRCTGIIGAMAVNCWASDRSIGARVEAMVGAVGAA